MSLQELGALGEFLGFVAVLVTLVYLSVQTRNAKRAAQMESCRQMVSDFQALWMRLSDDELALLVRRSVNDWDSLTKNEQLRVHSFFGSMIVHYIGALSQEHLPEVKSFIGVWENNLLGLLQCEGGRKWYEGFKYLAPDHVVQRLDERFSEPDSLPGAWNEGMPWWRLDEGELN